MRTTDDCKMEDGFLNYLTFLFCIIGDKLVALGLTLLVSIKKHFFGLIISYNQRLVGYSFYSLVLV
jgi:hypothetical protein